MNAAGVVLRRYFRSGRLHAFLFTVFYTAAFSVAFFLGGNYEFVIYTAVMLAAACAGLYLLKDTELPARFLWALSLVGVLHMLGGGIHVNGGRLYALQILPLFSGSDSGLVLFKYDQLVHMVGYGVFAAVLHYIVRRTYPDASALARSLIVIFVTMGAGSLAEMAEFSAVLTLPSTGVGDYANTLLDLTFNTLGAVIAVAGYEIFLTRKR